MIFISSKITQGNFSEIKYENLRRDLTHRFSTHQKNICLNLKQFCSYALADTNPEFHYSTNGFVLPGGQEELRVFEDSEKSFTDKNLMIDSVSIPKNEFLFKIADLLLEEERVLIKILPFFEVTPEKIEELGASLEEGESFFGIIATQEDLHVTPLLIRRKRAQLTRAVSFQISVLDSINLKRSQKKYEPFLQELRDSSNIKVKVIEGERQADSTSCRIDALYLLQSALIFFRDHSKVTNYLIWKRFFNLSKTTTQKNIPIDWIKGAQIYEKNKTKEAMTLVTDLDGRKISLKDFRKKYRDEMFFAIYERGRIIASTNKEVMSFYPQILRNYIRTVPLN